MRIALVLAALLAAGGFKARGFSLPDGAVKVDEVEPGDLLFFTTTDPGASHVAIALGSDEFVHAPSSDGVVRVERLSSTYWQPRFLGARRID